MFISLRSRLIVAICVVILLFGALLIFFTKTILFRNLEKELQKRAVYIAKNIASESIDIILTDNILELKLLIYKNKEIVEGIEYLFILDKEGRFLVHTFKEKFPAGLKEANIYEPGQAYNIQPLIIGKKHIFDIAYPILHGELGVLHLGVSEEPVISSITDITEKIVWIILGILALESIVMIILSGRVTKPVRQLISAVRKIGGGNFDINVDVESNDEVGLLTWEFRQMAEVLKTTTVRRDELAKEVVERKQLENKLKVMSITDELTGVYNRRGFLTLSNHLLKQVKRQKQGIFMLYADLDNLKWINDSLGHKEGDKALIEFASILTTNYRESDIIGRLGGDEFAVIPVGTATNSVDVIKARLQEKLDIHNAESSRRYPLSVSVGIVFYDPENPCSIDELLTQADILMYEEKEHKRK